MRCCIHVKIFIMAERKRDEWKGGGKRKIACKRVDVWMEVTSNRDCDNREILICNWHFLSAVMCIKTFDSNVGTLRSFRIPQSFFSQTGNASLIKLMKDRKKRSRYPISFDDIDEMNIWQMKRCKWNRSGEIYYESRVELKTCRWMIRTRFFCSVKVDLDFRIIKIKTRTCIFSKTDTDTSSFKCRVIQTVLKYSHTVSSQKWKTLFDIVEWWFNANKK